MRIKYFSKMKLRLPLLLFSLLTLLLFSFSNSPLKPKEKGTLVLQFQHLVKDKYLSFDSSYKNSMGEDFTVSKFKYYISNIELSNSNTGKKHFFQNSYFLIDEEDVASKTISLEIPAGEYSAISFLLGVDSIKNMSGAQADALDPINGMFWTWNSGYIMAKLEGSSSHSKSVHNKIEYHIGGFKKEDNTLKTIQFSLPQVVKLDETKKALITLEADIATWFSKKYELPISQYPACTIPGKLAVQFAENYKDMFRIKSVGTN